LNLGLTRLTLKVGHTNDVEVVKPNLTAAFTCL